jgi:L-threonylcarbamoyladenylate synthase
MLMNIELNRANTGRRPPPANLDEIAMEIREGVDYIVRWGQNDTRPRLPSSIIELGLGGQVKIIRE